MILLLLLNLLLSNVMFAKEELFQTPAFISAKVSPSGELVAHVGADEAGIANIFVSPKGSKEPAKLSSFKSPEIIQFFWSADSGKVLCLKDEDGTNQLNLHGFDVELGREQVYTESFSGVTTKMVKLSSEKNQAVIGINERNRYFHDLYRLDLDSGALTLIFENDAFAKFLVNDDLEIALKMRINADGSWSVLTGDDELFMELSSEQAFNTEFLSCGDGGVYFLDNRRTNTNQLVFKPFVGEERVLGGQDESDVDEVLFLEGKPVAYASYYTQKKWHAVDEVVADELAFLEAQVGSNFEVVSQSRDGAVWILKNSIPDLGKRCWIYEREGRQLELIYGTKGQFAKMYELVATARDGKELVCYYTLPPELDKGGYVDAPIPLVVTPHGGPFKVRDKYEFDAHHQWLASLGYAAISVNFRLSSGFGKDFVNAGNGEWGGKAHLDVIDAVEACIAKGISEKGKLAIMGGSYGGYETLAALTFTPDYFTCCVAICGPSNLKTVLEGVPQFWEFTSSPLSDHTMFFTKSAFITSMGGNPDDAAGAAYLEKCSPLNHLEAIKAPLLLVHGKNDHVVVENESRQIYESMKKNNKSVTYVHFPDEGHRFAKFANNMMYLDQIELFLQENLGGKYRPIDKKIADASSAIILK